MCTHHRMRTAAMHITQLINPHLAWRYPGNHRGQQQLLGNHRYQTTQLRDKINRFTSKKVAQSWSDAWQSLKILDKTSSQERRVLWQQDSQPTNPYDWTVNLCWSSTTRTDRRKKDDLDTIQYTTIAHDRTVYRHGCGEPSQNDRRKWDTEHHVP